MRNPFRRKRLDREELIAALPPEVQAYWPPSWARNDHGRLDDAVWLASYVGFVSGTTQALRDVGAQS